MLNTESKSGKGLKIGLEQIRVDNIPAELKAKGQWVAWNYEPSQDGVTRKKPKNARNGKYGSSTDPRTWGSFDEAMATAKAKGFCGVGWVFAKGGPARVRDWNTGKTVADDTIQLPTDCYAGIDIDGCIDPDTGAFTNPAAMEICDMLGSYVEVSPSGTGVKAIIKVEEPLNPAGKNGTWTDEKGNSVKIEAYESGRFFCLTGHTMNRYEASGIGVRQKTFRRLLSEAGMLRVNSHPVPRRAHNQTATPVPAEVQSEEDMLRAALSSISSDAEGTWFKMGCCLKSWGSSAGDDRAKALWDRWSESSGKYEQSSQDDRWARIEPDRGLTIATIFSDAAAEGYEYGEAIRPDGTPYCIDRSPEWVGMLDGWHSEFKAERATAGAKPVVELHSVGGHTHVRLTDAAARLGDALSNCGELFSRNGTVVYVRNGATAPVEAHDLAAVADRHACLVLRKESKGKDGPRERLVQSTATPGQCQDYLAAREFRDRLPQLRLISKCPVLVGDGNGGLRTVKGYDRDSGVLATGGGADDMPLEEARGLIVGMLADFDFATPSDRSRAIAAVITPALVMGGLLPGRAPIDLGEADDSQAGKGYRQKLITAVYNDSPTPVLQRKGGTGSTEESYCAALISGACFISLDNVRGRIDSPLIESSLTEDFCDARMPYGKPMQVDMRRTCIAMTSNDAQLTNDLARRCSPVRIRRRLDGYRFRVYPEGELLAHVRANQGRYLGAVFAVVRAWAAAGRPMEEDSGHDFRGWARTLGWIVRQVFGAPPLCDGVRETQARMANPNRGWARELALVAIRNGCSERPMRAHHIVRMLEDSGTEVPGVEPGADMSDDANFRKANQAVGRRLSAAFGRPAGDAPDVLAIDDMAITRHKDIDDGKSVFSYVFSTSKRAENALGGDQAENGPPLGGNTEPASSGVTPSGGAGSGAPPNGQGFPPNAPPNVPPEKPLIPPNPPNGLHTFHNTSISIYHTSLGGNVINMVRKNGDLQADQAEIPPFVDDGFLDDDPDDDPEPSSGSFSVVSVAEGPMAKETCDVGSAGQETDRNEFADSTDPSDPTEEWAGVQGFGQVQDHTGIASTGQQVDKVDSRGGQPVKDAHLTDNFLEEIDDWVGVSTGEAP